MGKSTDLVRVIEELGLLLRKQREHRAMSQRDVAHKLGYRNFNFITMLEKGNSNIPFVKIPDIVEAYGLPHVTELVIVLRVYPDIYATIMKIRSNNAVTFKRKAEDITPVLEKEFVKLMVEFRIGDYKADKTLEAHE